MPPEQPYRILLADDDFDEIELLKTAFEKSPRFEIVGCVNNGQEIIEAIEKSKLRPDVLFTDMYMPVLNGLEATEILRMNAENDGMSVILFSATINPLIIEKASLLRIVGTLTKPFIMEGYEGLPDKVASMMEEGNG